MNYERLKTFIAVSEKKSFSEAARILHLTQPTVTAHVKSLEEELNTKLFNRTTKKVELTQSAKILLGYAKEIVRLTDSAQKDIDQIEEVDHGELSIGCSLTIGEYILPKFLKKFKEAYPLIQVSVEITNSQNILMNIKDQTFDVGLIETLVDDQDIVLEPFMEDELILIADANYFKEEIVSISMEKLKKLPLILREKGSGTRAVFHQYLHQSGLTIDDMNIVMELGSTQAIKSAVEAGLGVAIISKSAIMREQQLGIFKAIPIKHFSFSRYFYIAYRADKVLQKTSEIFINDVKSYLTKDSVLV